MRNYLINYLISIPRAKEELIKALIDAGILYIGSDNQIHVKED